MTKYNMNTNNASKMNQEHKKSSPTKKPNEQVGFHFSSSMKITDPKTGKVSESTVIVKIAENSIQAAIASTNGSFIGGNICLENQRKTQ